MRTYTIPVEGSNDGDPTRLTVGPGREAAVQCYTQCGYDHTVLNLTQLIDYLKRDEPLLLLALVGPEVHRGVQVPVIQRDHVARPKEVAFRLTEEVRQFPHLIPSWARKSIAVIDGSFRFLVGDRVNPGEVPVGHWMFTHGPSRFYLEPDEFYRRYEIIMDPGDDFHGFPDK